MKMLFFLEGSVQMSRVVLFLACGWLAWSGTGCAKSGTAVTETAERNSALYRQAFAAEQSGDINEAIRLYNKVLIDEPKSFSAHFQLATLLHDHKEDYIGAIYHYNQYLYLRPESEKSTLARDRVRIAEQLLAPQILRKVGDSVQGISQAHLLKENDRLNRLITTLEGEKSVLMEAKAAADKDLAGLRSDNVRLREILAKMRVDDTVAQPSESILKRVEAAVLKKDEAGSAPAKADAKTLRALREEAASLGNGEGTKQEGVRKPQADIPSAEAVLKKVQTRLEGGAGDAGDCGSARAEGRACAEGTVLVFRERDKGRKAGEGQDGAVRERGQAGEGFQAGRGAANLCGSAWRHAVPRGGKVLWGLHALEEDPRCQ